MFCNNRIIALSKKTFPTSKLGNDPAKDFITIFTIFKSYVPFKRFINLAWIKPTCNYGLGIFITTYMTAYTFWKFYYNIASNHQDLAITLVSLITLSQQTTNTMLSNSKPGSIWVSKLILTKQTVSNAHEVDTPLPRKKCSRNCYPTPPYDNMHLPPFWFWTNKRCTIGTYN